MLVPHLDPDRSLPKISERVNPDLWSLLIRYNGVKSQPLFSQNQLRNLFLEFYSETKPKFLSSKVTLSMIMKSRNCRCPIIDYLEFNISMGNSNLISFEKLLSYIRTRRRILPVTQLKTDEYLTLRLSPLQNWCCLHMLFS